MTNYDPLNLVPLYQCTKYSWGFSNHFKALFWFQNLHSVEIDKSHQGNLGSSITAQICSLESSVRFVHFFVHFFGSYILKHFLVLLKPPADISSFNEPLQWTSLFLASYHKKHMHYFPFFHGLILVFQKLVDINNIPLTEPVPGLSEARYLKHTDVKPFETRLTVLENGLSVATEPHYGMYCTVGGGF